MVDDQWNKAERNGSSLVIGHWSLVIGHWSLVIGHWSLVIGHWSLVIGHFFSPSPASKNTLSSSPQLTRTISYGGMPRDESFSPANSSPASTELTSSGTAVWPHSQAASLCLTSCCGRMIRRVRPQAWQVSDATRSRSSSNRMEARRVSEGASADSLADASGFHCCSAAEKSAS